MILGLDISTSITGYTILDDAGAIICCDHIDLTKIDAIINKASLVCANLEKLFALYPIKQVWIEESLQMFSMGKSSAKTLATLTKFNGIISWIVFDKFGINPQHIPAVSARKLCGVKLQKGKRGKECVIEHMAVNEKWFQIHYTKTGNIKSYIYDRADSFIIARAGYLKNIK